MLPLPSQMARGPGTRHSFEQYPCHGVRWIEAEVLVGGGAPPVDPNVVTKLPRALPLEPGEGQEVTEKAPVP